MMDPKPASTKKSGQALGWLRQNLMHQASGPVMKVRKAGTQTSYTPLKGKRERFGALQSQTVKIQPLKKEY
jgi:hypothetical protein